MLGMDSVEENSVMFEVIFVTEDEAFEDQARSMLASYRETVKKESVRLGLDVEYEYLKWVSVFSSFFSPLPCMPPPPRENTNRFMS